MMLRKRKMKLTGNGSRARNVKNADPNTGEFLWCPERLFFHFQEMYKLEICDFLKKRSAGTRSHNEVVFQRVWEFSQQAHDNRRAEWPRGGTPGIACEVV